MNKQNQGYGICGAKNVYSSRSKLGNWVEDEAGVLLASKPRPPVGYFVTVQAEKHCDPRDMTPHPSMTSIKMLSTVELKAKNKDGTPYALLFNHGKELPIEERFLTTTNRMFSKPDTLMAPGTLARNKEKAKMRETRFISEPTSNSRLADAYAFRSNAPPVYQPNCLIGQPLQPLPIWNRSDIISKHE